MDGPTWSVSSSPLAGRSETAREIDERQYDGREWQKTLPRKVASVDDGARDRDDGPAGRQVLQRMRTMLVLTPYDQRPPQSGSP